MSPKKFEVNISGFTSWNQYYHSEEGLNLLGHNVSLTKHPDPSCIREAVFSIRAPVSGDKYTRKIKHNVDFWISQMKGAISKTDWCYRYTGVNDQEPAYLFSTVVEKMGSRLRDFEDMKHTHFHARYSAACDLVKSKEYMASGSGRTSVFSSARQTGNSPSRAYLTRLLTASREFDRRSKRKRHDWAECAKILSSVANDCSLSRREIFQYYLTLDSVEMAHENWLPENSAFGPPRASESLVLMRLPENPVHTAGSSALDDPAPPYSAA